MKRTMRIGVPSGFGAQSLRPMASHVSRQLIGQAVEREGRDEADNGFRNALGNLSQAMVGSELRIGKLIETAGKPQHLSIPFHTAQGGCSDPCVPQFCQTCYAALS